MRCLVLEGFVESLFVSGGESKVFLDVGWLQPLSPPPSGVPVGREDDVRVLAVCLADVFKTGVGRNVFVFGKPGTGKTLCVQYVLQKLGEHAVSKGLDVLVVYVNVGKTRSPYFTLLEIARAIGVNAPSSGWQFIRLKEEFERVRSSRPIVIALDEVESLVLKEREPLIYYLNRQPNVTLVLISNKFEDITMLPDRAKSTLQPLPVKFGAYTKEKAKQILVERVAKAFQPNVVPEWLLDRLGLVAEKRGDLRICFNVLLTAGLLAEKAGKSQIEEEHIIDAAKLINHTI